MTDLNEDDFSELQIEIEKEKEGLIYIDKTKTIKEDKNENIDIDSRTGFRIKIRIVSEKKCNIGLKNVQFIPLDQVESHTKSFNSIHVGVKPSPHWSTIAVVDKCYLQDDFCVTRITNMRGIYTNLYITGKAYKAHENAIGMGSIVAIKRPFLLKPTEPTQSVALHVDQLQQVWVIGQSLDLVQCSSYISKDKRCDEWIDIRSGDYCNNHLERMCRYSKNGRMELASGDSGFDIRWATKKKQADGTFVYESKREKINLSSSFNFGFNSNKKVAYYLKGKGLVATDGSLIKKKPNPKLQNSEEKNKLEEFLKGRRDPGAEMIRMVKGIKEDTPKSALSKEAMSKMGIGCSTLTKEEEEAKKRSFEALTRANEANTSENETVKKPRYVYL